MGDVETSATLPVRDIVDTPGISKEVVARILEADKNAGKSTSTVLVPLEDA
jgi:hypothetical protein